MKKSIDVKVISNSERISSAARIGDIGEVIGQKGKDLIVKFKDGSIGSIIEKDLVKIEY